MSFIQTIPTNETDQELLSSYKDTAEQKYVGELYQRYLDLVYGVCLKYLLHPEDAKDAVIDIYEELIVKLRIHTVLNFKGWLYQLSKNHCLMHIRKRKVDIVNVDISIVQSYESLHLESEEPKEQYLSKLETCIGKLVKEQKIMVSLFYLQNRCYKEISIITGEGLGKVRSNIQNGKRNLKICMGKIH